MSVPQLWTCSVLTSYSSLPSQVHRSYVYDSLLSALISPTRSLVLALVSVDVRWRVASALRVWRVLLALACPCCMLLVMD